MKQVMQYKDLDHALKYLRSQVIESIPYAQHDMPALRSPEEIFNWLKLRTTYKHDPRGIELFHTLPSLMHDNFHGITGAGDCDCFTIAALATLLANGFDNVGITLAGRNSSVPVHIWAWVNVKGKKKNLDLTNKNFDQTRYYPFTQDIQFKLKPEDKMLLQLQDGDEDEAPRPRRRRPPVRRRPMPKKKKRGRGLFKLFKAGASFIPGVGGIVSSVLPDSLGNEGLARGKHRKFGSSVFGGVKSLTRHLPGGRFVNRVIPDGIGDEGLARGKRRKFGSSVFGGVKSLTRHLPGGKFVNRVIPDGIGEPVPTIYFPKSRMIANARAFDTMPSNDFQRMCLSEGLDAEQISEQLSARSRRSAGAEKKRKAKVKKKKEHAASIKKGKQKKAARKAARKKSIAHGKAKQNKKWGAGIKGAMDFVDNALDPEEQPDEDMDPEDQEDEPQTMPLPDDLSPEPEDEEEDEEEVEDMGEAGSYRRPLMFMGAALLIGTAVGYARG